MELTNWKTLYKKEAWGSGGTFGVEIRVAMDREFNENDKKNSYRIADQIEDAILRESARLSPELQKEREAEEKHLMACFPDTVFYEPIPNGYCSRHCCEMSPWYRVTTRKGVVTIGWRKRVISIEWEARVNPASADELFPSEDVTKIDRLIHAWGYDKAKEYVFKLLM